MKTTCERAAGKGRNMRASVRIAALLSLLFLVAACVDLDVENPNDPDRERALARPSDVETLISGSFRGWWYVQYYTWDACFSCEGDSPSLALSVMSDQHSSSHGNSMMNHSSQEPRKKILNDQLYRYSWVVEQPWSTSYSVLAAARDGLIALDGGLRIGEGGADTQRARAFAKLLQGLGHGDLALIYDQAAGSRPRGSGSDLRSGVHRG
jgi:hypothetical protein